MRRNRRTFIKESAQYAIGLGLLAGLSSCGGRESTEETGEEAETAAAELFFRISLAQWSFHRALGEKKLDNLDFAAKARSLGIDGIEYVNQFFMDKAKDTAYLNEMIKRADDNGVRSLLIMIDGEGNLGAPDAKERMTAIENHYKWVDAAKHLGCHSIRVNAYGIGTAEDVQKAAIDSLGKLGEYATSANINVIVENHGSYSSDGIWLTTVMQTVGKPNVGTLPDFGNFCLRRKEGDLYESECIEEYDRYKGVQEMMPFAKAVSAKSYDFDETGKETTIDYLRIMKIVKDAGYTGFVGIEYEGDRLSEEEGVRATKSLLERVGRELSAPAG